MFYVKKAYKLSTRDNWSQGEDPNTTEEIDIEAEGFYSSLDDLADKLDLTNDKDAWMAFDDGRIICSVAENHFGEEPSDREMEQFKAEEIDLFACEYNFYVQFIEGMFTPSTVEMAKKFNIEEYD